MSGVACEDATFHARRGVVLAAGDFTNDPELKSRYMGPQEAKVEGVNVTATGDGQKLALPLGARIINGDLALGPEIRFIPPARTTLVRRLPPWRGLARTMEWAMDHVPQALLRPFIMGFLTTALAPSHSLFQQGAAAGQPGRTPLLRRAGPSRAWRCPISRASSATSSSMARLARQFSAWPHFVSTAPGVAYAYVPDYRRNRPDVYTEASSLGELARKLGMDQQALQTAIAERTQQRSVASGDGAVAHRAYLSASRLSSPLGPVRSVFVHNEGGLAVDDIAPCARCARSADPRALCGRRYRSGRAAVERPRPPPGLGVCFGTPRGAICRAGGNPLRSVVVHRLSRIERPD